MLSNSGGRDNHSPPNNPEPTASGGSESDKPDDAGKLKRAMHKLEMQVQECYDSERSFHEKIGALYAFLKSAFSEGSPYAAVIVDLERSGKLGSTQKAQYAQMMKLLEQMRDNPFALPSGSTGVEALTLEEKITHWCNVINGKTEPNASPNAPTFQKIWEAMSEWIAAGAFAELKKEVLDVIINAHTNPKYAHLNLADASNHFLVRLAEKACSSDPAGAALPPPITFIDFLSKEKLREISRTKKSESTEELSPQEQTTKLRQTVTALKTKEVAEVFKDTSATVLSALNKPADNTHRKFFEELEIEQTKQEAIKRMMKAAKTTLDAAEKAVARAESLLSQDAREHDKAAILEALSIAKGVVTRARESNNMAEAMAEALNDTPDFSRVHNRALKYDLLLQDLQKTLVDLHSTKEKDCEFGFPRDEFRSPGSEQLSAEKTLQLVRYALDNIQRRGQIENEKKRTEQIEQFLKERHVKIDHAKDAMIVSNLVTSFKGTTLVPDVIMIVGNLLYLLEIRLDTRLSPNGPNYPNHTEQHLESSTNGLCVKIKAIENTLQSAEKTPAEKYAAVVCLLEYLEEMRRNKIDTIVDEIAKIKDPAQLQAAKSRLQELTVAIKKLEARLSPDLALLEAMKAPEIEKALLQAIRTGRCKRDEREFLKIFLEKLDEYRKPQAMDNKRAKSSKKHPLLRALKRKRPLSPEQREPSLSERFIKKIRQRFGSRP